jgi:hypothetical protein
MTFCSTLETMSLTTTPVITNVPTSSSEKKMVMTAPSDITQLRRKLDRVSLKK